MLARIGEVEIWRVLETVDPLMPLFEFYPDLTPEMFAAHSDAVLPGTVQTDPDDGTPWLVIPVQSFLLKTPSNVILVDACIGNDKTLPPFEQFDHMTGNRFMAGLEASGTRVEDVDYVLCTHLHMDHVGWTTRLENGKWVPTFPNAKVLATAPELQIAREQAEKASARQIAGWMFQETIAPLLEADCMRAIDLDDQIDPAIRLYPTPGHMPGHVSIEIMSGGLSAGMVTGDTLHSSLQCALPEIAVIADADPEMAAASRRKMLAYLSETGALAFGTHIALPSVGRVRKKGDAWVWDPVV